MGQVSKETVVLRRWGVLQDNLVLSTELIMWIGHRKEIEKLTFSALARRRRVVCGLYVQKDRATLLVGAW